ncbi:MAG TPA: hypothetical protein VGH98_19325 [Gemmatimonadaceae bacterium]|jgi:hypothetical protein
MTYTLWHRKQLIGETDFEQENGESAPQRGERCHLVGSFHPTAYGQRLLPRLCGMLTAGFELKEELVRRGLPADDPPPEIVEQLFETTAAGAHIIDIGRVLSEVELRDLGGVTLQVASMAFIDLGELASLSRRLGETVEFEEAQSDEAKFLVSVTLRDLSPDCVGMLPLQ